MKIQLSLAAFLLSGAVMASCPDFSGTYLQRPDSCQSKETRSPWPLDHQSEETLVVVQQMGCDSLKITYKETRYSNHPVKEVAIDLKEAQKTEVKDGQMKFHFSRPKERVNSFGHTLNAKERTKLVLKKLSENDLLISTESTMSGFFDYVLPIRDHSRSKCVLEKVSN